MKPVATVIFIHGYTGSPDRPRYHWLRRELEARGVSMVAPQLPSPNHPIESDWLDTIDTQVATAAAPIILVGHSLGGLAVLRWLETRATQPVYASISLAGVTLPTRHVGRTFSKNWLAPTDWSRIRSRVRHLVGIYSRDDTAVEPMEGEHFQVVSQAEVVWVDGRGHFTDSDGTTELPDLLQVIETLVQLAK